MLPAWLLPGLLLPVWVGCGATTDNDASPPAAESDMQGSDMQSSHLQGASDTEGIALLVSEADQQAARDQGICPVSDEPLGSMGKPIKLEVEGREVFICCSGCEDSLREEPQKYFTKLDQAAPDAPSEE